MSATPPQLFLPTVGLHAVIINPQQYDVLYWNPIIKQWINGQLSSIFTIYTDSSLSGAGTETSLLGLATQTTAGTYNNASFTFNNRGVLTGVTPGAGIVYVDGFSIGPSGAQALPLKLICPIFDPAYVINPTCDYMLASNTVSGNTAFTIGTTPLDTAYNNLIDSSALSAGGVYTSKGTARMLVTLSVNSTDLGVGNYIKSIGIFLSNSKASNKQIAFSSNTGNAQPAQMSTSAYTPVIFTDQLYCVITPNGTASQVTFTAKISFLQQLF